MRKLIIDCDPGIDDALAILLALASRTDLDLLGVTCVRGNVALDKTHANARRILAAAGRLDIPVLRGLAGPILSPARAEAKAHGSDGLGGLDLPEPDLPVPEVTAADFIRQQAALYPGEVMLCPIGPLSNVAVALLSDPLLAGRLHSIVFMGGAAFCPGNMNEHAEFNFLGDPHAAQVVMQSGARLVMFGLDVTLLAKIEPAHLDRLRRNGSRCSVIAADLLQVYAVRDLHLHDPCALAWALDPTLFHGVQAKVHVVTDSGPTFGQSVATPDPAGNCLVITGVDQERLFDLLIGRLALLP